jgi:hypothetical protein
MPTPTCQRGKVVAKCDVVPSGATKPASSLMVGFFLVHTKAWNGPPMDWAIYTKLLRPANRQSS